MNLKEMMCISFLIFLIIQLKQWILKKLNLKKKIESGFLILIYNDILWKKKIVITGGTGRFGALLKQKKNSSKLFFPSKKELDILNFKNIKKYLLKTKPEVLIHLAGLSRPMAVHDNDIKKILYALREATNEVQDSFKSKEKKSFKL